MEQHKRFSTNDIARMFDVSAQDITRHARLYNIGSRLNKRDYVFTEKDIEKLTHHIGQYGNPNFTPVYREWSLERYCEFVEMNRLSSETGYNHSEEELAEHFDISTRTVRGMRRRHKLAARICMSEYGELDNKKIAKLMKENTESTLRKRRKGTQPLQTF